MDSYPQKLRPLIESLQQQYQQRGWQRDIDSIYERVEKVAQSCSPSPARTTPRLKQMGASAPPLLYVRGAVENLHLPQIAIVGSRRMTRGGEKNASEWSQLLARGGFAITSGLAHGIDAVAHAGALSAKGKTIAVMGTGIDTIYPRQHSRLAEEILNLGGTLITEFRPGTPPLPTHFPQQEQNYQRPQPGGAGGGRPPREAVP